MGANDGEGRKVAVQTLYVRQLPVLDVENHGFGTVPDYIVAQFPARLGYVNGEMRAKSTGQGPRNSRILLEHNDIGLSHSTPFQPSSTADVDIRLGLRGGLKYHNSTDI